jgi:hypothetical protein
VFVIRDSTCGQHAHHKRKQAAGGAQAAIEEDATQEGAEEAVDDFWRKALGLQGRETRVLIDVWIHKKKKSKDQARLKAGVTAELTARQGCRR